MITSILQIITCFFVIILCLYSIYGERQRQAVIKRINKKIGNSGSFEKIIIEK